MNYTEILNKITDIFNDSDEYLAILVDFENIKAVSVAGRRYMEFCSFSPDAEIDICGIFRTIENYITIVDNKLDHLAQLVCDIANGKITPESSLTETEGVK